jgi:hypothetical protein
LKSEVEVVEEKKEEKQKIDEIFEVGVFFFPFRSFSTPSLLTPPLSLSLSLSLSPFSLTSFSASRSSSPASTTTLVVPSPTSSSCTREMSTSTLAAGLST